MNTFSRLEGNEIAEHSLSEYEIKRRFPNTSFCDPFVPPPGYMIEAESPERPEPGPLEDLVSLPPAWIDGVLTRQYRVEPASPEEAAQRTAAHSAVVRLERNRRLAAADWTQLPDSGVDQEAWASYRQALRALTEQEGFPWEVIWPTPPIDQAPSTVPQAQQAEPPPAETLGQVWTDPDGVNWVVVQARQSNGQFAADDPATEARENLTWDRV